MRRKDTGSVHVEWINPTEQTKRGRMIVEDHNMPNCFAAYSDASRHDREDFLRSSRCCIRRPIVSNSHHFFLKFSRDDISRKFAGVGRQAQRHIVRFAASVSWDNPICYFG
jgi:hypothetical protein